MNPYDQPDKLDQVYRPPLRDWIYNSIAWIIASSIMVIMVLGLWKAIELISVLWR